MHARTRVEHILHTLAITGLCIVAFIRILDAHVPFQNCVAHSSSIFFHSLR